LAGVEIEQKVHDAWFLDLSLILLTQHPFAFRQNPIIIGDLEGLAFSWDEGAICLGLGFDYSYLTHIGTVTIASRVRAIAPSRMKRKGL
jgi:hypothetical protein